MKSAHITRISLVGAVGAAIAASACCLLPAVLAVVGFSGLGLAAALEPYRPLFLVATTGLLAVGFYLAYRRPVASKATDDCDCPMPRANRSGRRMLRIASVLVVAFAAYPYVAGAFAEDSARGATAAVPDARTARFRIAGMTCRACSSQITDALAHSDGVVTAAVDYDDATATVTYDPARTTAEALVPVVDGLGYRAAIVEP